METLHPALANLRYSLETMKEDEAYYRRIGVAYTAEGLMKALQDKKPKSAMPLVCHSLADIGATQAVPLLKSLVDFPVADVKATSVLAVARLAGKDETSWMIECLSRKGTDKAYVLWALAAVGDPLACEAVITWFEPVLRKLEKDPEADPRGKAVFAIAYLEQMPAPRAADMVQRFQKIAESLPSSTRRELAEHTRIFSTWK
jgi:HEAT repeat protein